MSWGLVSLEAGETAPSVIARADDALYLRRRAAAAPDEEEGEADRDATGAP